MRSIEHSEVRLQPIGSARTFLPLALLASVLFAVAAGCSSSRDGAIAVQLTYPSSPAPASAGPAPLAPSYATDPSDRIRIRVLGPDFAPIEKWFDRSGGHGEIGNIPPGAHITVEVDEYDNTAVTLLGRGWFNGITLSAGETKTVPVAMYAKGTIVTICGVPGTPGDSSVSGLGNEALLRNPPAVKVGPDDAIYVSSFTTTYGRVMKIDRYGYLSLFAGSGPHGAIVAGTSAASTPIDAVSDIDVDLSGNVYLFNYWNQIVRLDNGVVGNLLFDNGVQNPAARFDLAVTNVDLLYFVNYLDRRVYQLNVSSKSKSDFVTDGTPSQTAEPIDRLFYPLRGPSSITYAPAINSLVFADTDNDRIMRISLLDGNIYYLVANAGGTPFSEGIDPLAMAPGKPRVVDYNPITGKIFFVEQGTNRVVHIDAAGKVRVFAGTGVLGFSGDGGPATSAQLYDPRGVAVDSRGNAYIADYGNHAIRMVVGGALP